MAEVWQQSPEHDSWRIKRLCVFYRVLFASSDFNWWSRDKQVSFFEGGEQQRGTGPYVTVKYSGTTTPA